MEGQRDRAERIPISAIVFGANYRTDFDPAALRELADSIAATGLAQPVVVRPMPDGRYELLAGERRTRACMMLGWETIPATVKDVDDDTALALTLAENMGRVNTNPIEDARGYARARARGWTVEEIAKRTGQRRDVVETRLAFLGLREDIQKLIADGHLGVGYARSLALAELDANRQGIAIRRLRENPAPTVDWWATVVGELSQQQAQSAMFDLSLLVADVTTLTQATDTAKLPPLPSGEHDLPNEPKGGFVAKRTPRKALLAAYIEYWDDAAQQWEQLGKGAKAAECRAAAQAYKTAQAVMYQGQWKAGQ